MDGSENVSLMLPLMFIILLVVYSQTCNVNHWGDKEFGKCPPVGTRFQVFLKTSITDCIKQCAKRPVCKVIGYKRSYNMCELHTAASSETEEINDKKCIQIKMNSIDTSDTPQVGDGCSCVDWQVCDTNTSKCSYEECNPQTIMQPVTNGQGDMYGNINSGNSRKLLLCKPGFHDKMGKNLTVCNTTGQWNPIPECKAITNVALGKPAEQSSVFGERKTEYDAFNAVDGIYGNASLAFSSSSCFHTKEEVNPWWRVDLESLYYITSFILYNRVDEYAKRAHDIEVKVRQTLDTWTLLDYIPGALPTIFHKELTYGVLIRYVQVSIRSIGTTMDIFHLCEVELLGYSARLVIPVTELKPEKNVFSIMKPGHNVCLRQIKAKYSIESYWIKTVSSGLKFSSQFQNHE